MPIFPSQGGSQNTWGTELRAFFQTFFNLSTGAFVANSISHTELADKGTNTHSDIDTAISNSVSHIANTSDPHNTTWAQVDKTVSSIADITTKSHTALSDIGTNTHAQIDTFVSSKAAASGLASLDGSSLVVQNPANATATPAASKIPIADGSGDLDNGWINLSNGSSVLSADFTLDQANGTYQDTGVSVSLPAAGTYKISANVRGTVTMATGTIGYIAAKLYNSTDAADVTNSERLVTLAGSTGSAFQATAPIDIIITVAAAKTIKLYAKRDSATSWTTTTVLSNTAGRTNLSYIRIA